MKKVFLSLLAVLTLAACEQPAPSGGNGIQFIPFQVSQTAGWGLISPDGQVLVSNDYKSMPTVAMHNRFFAKNKDGKWELYSVEHHTKQLGGPYSQAGVFYADVAPVVEAGQAIEFIDVDGKVAFVLDRVDGKAVTTCTNFSDGVAVFRAGKYCGAVNTKGQVIVPPRYIEILPANEGKMLALDRKYERYLQQGDLDNIEYTVISTTGEELGLISTRRYKIASQSFRNGALVVTDESGDGSVRTGLINERGEWIVKASDNIKSIKAIQNSSFIYSDGDAYGVMNFQGEQLILPRYANLVFAGPQGLLFAQSDREKVEYKLIDMEEKQVGREVFSNVLPYIGDFAIVQENSNNWILIGKDGLDQKIRQDIYSITTSSCGDAILVSELADYESVIGALKLTKDGFLDMTLAMDAQHIAEAVAAAEQDDQVSGADAARYVNSKAVMGNCEVRGIRLTLSASFDENMAEIRNGNAVFTSYSPNQIGLEIPATGMLRGKSGIMARDLISRVEAFGQTVKSNQNSAIVQVGEAAYFIANSGTGVYVVYGYLDANLIDIGQYANIVDRDDVPVRRYEVDDIFDNIEMDDIFDNIEIGE